jgi:hypothetical protein
VAEVASEVGSEDGRVVFEVGEPARVVEQLPDGDLVAVRDESRKPALDAVSEAELAFADELENDGCGVGLGEARDPEAIVRSSPAPAAFVSGIDLADSGTWPKYGAQRGSQGCGSYSA